MSWNNIPRTYDQFLGFMTSISSKDNERIFEESDSEGENLVRNITVNVDASQNNDDSASLSIEPSGLDDYFPLQASFDYFDDNKIPSNSATPVKSDKNHTFEKVSSECDISPNSCVTSDSIDAPVITFSDTVELLEMNSSFVTSCDPSSIPDDVFGDYFYLPEDKHNENAIILKIGVDLITEDGNSSPEKKLNIDENLTVKLPQALLSPNFNLSNHAPLSSISSSNKDIYVADEIVSATISYVKIISTPFDNKFLDYRVHGSPPSFLCNFNMEVAKSLGLNEIVSVWKTAKQLTETLEMLNSSSSNKDTCFQPFSRHILGGIIGRKLLSFVKQLGDVSTLAALSCVLSIADLNGESVLYSKQDVEFFTKYTALVANEVPFEYDKQIPNGWYDYYCDFKLPSNLKHQHPVWLSIPSLKTCGVSIVYALIIERQIYDTWRVRYSEILYAAGKLTKRHEVLNFVNSWSLLPEIPCLTGLAETAQIITPVSSLGNKSVFKSTTTATTASTLLSPDGISPHISSFNNRNFSTTDLLSPSISTKFSTAKSAGHSISNLNSSFQMAPSRRPSALTVSPSMPILSNHSKPFSPDVIKKPIIPLTIPTKTLSIYNSSVCVHSSDHNFSSHANCTISSSKGLICSICRTNVYGLSTFCLSCHHGGHLEHVSDWFVNNEICATGCGCNCKLAMDQNN